MGFDGALLKSVLENFVDEIAEESSELILERPRFAYAVVVIADEQELCEASCIRQLDPNIVQIHENSSSYQDYYDSDIQRALQELKESRDLLTTPRASVAMESETDSYGKSEFYEMTAKSQPPRGIKETTNFIKTSGVQFPSSSRSQK